MPSKTTNIEVTREELSMLVTALKDYSPPKIKGTRWDITEDGSLGFDAAFLKPHLQGKLELYLN